MRFSDVSEVFKRFGGFRRFSNFGRFRTFRRFSDVFGGFRMFSEVLGRFGIFSDFGIAEVPSIAELRTILGQEPFPLSLIGSLSGRQWKPPRKRTDRYAQNN